MLLSNNQTIVPIQPLFPPRPIQFSFLLFIMIISIPCFIFVFYHLVTNRILVTALHNHTIILLLISNAIQTMTDVPIHLAYYYTGIIWPTSVYYCFFCYFIDFYLFTVSFLLLTWASIERHVLIFQLHFYATPIKRFVGHYMPLALCCLYPLIYYIIFFFFYPCENSYDDYRANCLVPCYLWVSSFMALYEQIAHGLAPMFLILIFNCLLLIRVLKQKQRMGRQLTWAKDRQMILQLFSICGLFFLTNGGYFIIQIGQLLYDESFARAQSAWIFPLSMCMPPLISFVCLTMLNNLREKLQRILPGNHSSMITPVHR
jgi:hypothetical protein